MACAIIHAALDPGVPLLSPPRRLLSRYRTDYTITWAFWDQDSSYINSNLTVDFLIFRGEGLTTPDYIRILKLDKLAMKSKTHAEYLIAVKERLQYAKNIGVEKNFTFFVDRAWLLFGTKE